MLTEERIKQMRADAISDPRNAQEFWYMLMARAIESEATAPLLARIAELEAEAKRYRWLRDASHWPAVFASHDAPEPITGNELDAAIDAAMKEQP
jgi:hypothetical protein